MKFGVGVVIIVFTIFTSFVVAPSASFAGRKCLKSDQNCGAKFKGDIPEYAAPVESMSIHGNNKAENWMGVKNEGMSRKETKEEESKEFENKDYASFNPSPSSRQPRHKSTPSRR